MPFNNQVVVEEVKGTFIVLVILMNLKLGELEFIRLSDYKSQILVKY